MIAKSFLAKVYDQDGTTLRKVLTSDRPDSGSGMHLKSIPTFTTRINGGQGECVLDVKTPFDDFEEGTTIDFMNIAKIYAVTIEDLTQTTTLIYTGFISRYEPYIEAGGEEGVRVTCLGLVSLLTRDFYADADLVVVHSTQDPTVIAKAVIDDFNTIYGGSLVSYDASSIPATVGSNVSVTFTDQKWFDCVKKCGELAGTNWWWAVREDGKLYFKAKPSSATHTFTIGKDIVSLSCPKDSEEVVNFVYLRRNGGTETTYEDTTSQADFGTGSPATGRCAKIISDTSLTDVGAADQRGNKEINDNKDEKIRATLVVNSKYSLESIHVGETCKIRHFRSANTFFSDNMMIASVSYDGDTCTLELEQQAADFGLALEEFVG